MILHKKKDTLIQLCCIMEVTKQTFIQLLLRGDSGFATPDLYKQCEENGTSYVIRLNENNIRREKASFLADEFTRRTQNNEVDLRCGLR